MIARFLKKEKKERQFHGTKNSKQTKLDIVHSAELTPVEVDAEEHRYAEDLFALSLCFCLPYSFFPSSPNLSQQKAASSLTLVLLDASYWLSYRP